MTHPFLHNSLDLIGLHLLCFHVEEDGTRRTLRSTRSPNARQERCVPRRSADLSAEALQKLNGAQPRHSQSILEIAGIGELPEHCRIDSVKFHDMYNQVVKFRT